MSFKFRIVIGDLAALTSVKIVMLAIFDSEIDQIPAATPSNIMSYGYMGWNAYDAILCQADVAFGTLASHRK